MVHSELISKLEIRSSSVDRQGDTEGRSFRKMDCRFRPKPKGLTISPQPTFAGLKMKVFAGTGSIDWECHSALNKFLGLTVILTTEMIRWAYSVASASPGGRTSDNGSQLRMHVWRRTATIVSSEVRQLSNSIPQVKSHWSGPCRATAQSMVNDNQMGLTVLVKMGTSGSLKLGAKIIQLFKRKIDSDWSQDYPT